MGRPRNISNIYNPPKSNTNFSEGAKSKGILDDSPVRTDIATKEGTIEHTPTEDNHIVNKKYVDDSIFSPSGATGSFLSDGGAETITVVNGIITLITSANFFILLEIGDFILLETGDKIING